MPPAHSSPGASEPTLRHLSMVVGAQHVSAVMTGRPHHLHRLRVVAVFSAAKHRLMPVQLPTPADHRRAGQSGGGAARGGAAGPSCKSPLRPMFGADVDGQRAWPHDALAVCPLRAPPCVFASGKRLFDCFLKKTLVSFCSLYRARCWRGWGHAQQKQGKGHAQRK